MLNTMNHSGVECGHIKPRRNIWARITAMIAIRQQRRSLKELDTHILQDIGVTNKEAMLEAEKPIWDVPQHWKN